MTKLDPRLTTRLPQRPSTSTSTTTSTAPTATQTAAVTTTTPTPTSTTTHDRAATSKVLGTDAGRAADAPRSARGAQVAALGARLLGSVKTATKVAVTTAVLGCTLALTPHQAAADVIYAGKNPVIQQAAQRIAQQVGEPFVHIRAEPAALAAVVARAQAGEIRLTHLIIDDNAGALRSLQSWNNGQHWHTPKVFADVKQVHVLGHGASLDGVRANRLFPNAVVTSLDTRSVLFDAHKTAFVLEDLATAAQAVPQSVLTALHNPHDAAPLATKLRNIEIQAKALATRAVDRGMRVQVALGDMNSPVLMAPRNTMTAFLDQASTSAPLSQQALLDQLTSMAKSPEGLTDGAIGALFWRLQEPGFAADFDATRLGLHVVDIRRAAGAEKATEAVLSGTVHEVRQALAEATSTAPYAQERSPVFGTDVRRGLPLSAAGPLATGGLQGQAYVVNGVGVIRNGEVNLQAITHPTHGNGLQMTFKLGRAAGAQLETFLAAQAGTRLIDKVIINAPPKNGRVVVADRADMPSSSSSWVQSEDPSMRLGPALRFEEAGKFRLDYFSSSTSKQALRGEVQLTVFGRTEAAQKDALHSVLQQIGLADAISHAPSPEAEKTLIGLRLLEQADPRAHHQMMGRIESGEAIGPAELHRALSRAAVPPAFLSQAYFAEASPGHLSVIVPGQSEAYQRQGVRAVYHTVGNAEVFAFIAKDGALMSTKDRLQVNKVFRGMSSDEDLNTGGADFVFTRQVTASMGNPLMSIMRGGAIVMKPDVKDRADWFSYTGDNFGTTLAGDRPEVSAAVRSIAERTFAERSAAGDTQVAGQTAEGWLSSVIPARQDHREDIFLNRPTGRSQVAQTSQSTNETMLEGSVPLSQMQAFLVPSEESRQKVLKKLEELGITTINGRPASEFVQTRTDTFFTDEEWKAIQEQAAKEKKDAIETDDKVRLDFYVQTSPTPTPASAGTLLG